MGEASLAIARRRVLAAGLLAAALVPCGSLVLAGEADAPRMRQVGFCSTGFGVPGSGRPFVFGTQVLLNAGEGCPTVYDVSNPRAPRVLRHIPTWFFTTFIYPLPSRDLVYLGSSRGPLLVLKGLSTWGRKGDVKEIPWQSSWGRSFLSAIRPDGMAYTLASEQIVVLDLSKLAAPKIVATFVESMPTE